MAVDVREALILRAAEVRELTSARRDEDGNFAVGWNHGSGHSRFDIGPMAAFLTCELKASFKKDTFQRPPVNGREFGHIPFQEPTAAEQRSTATQAGPRHWPLSLTYPASSSTSLRDPAHRVRLCYEPQWMNYRRYTNFTGYEGGALRPGAPLPASGSQPIPSEFLARVAPPAGTIHITEHPRDVGGANNGIHARRLEGR